MPKPPPISPAPAVPPPRRRPNRKRRDWGPLIRRVCAVALVAELGALAFANPHWQVTQVQINGLRTLPAPQVFAEARVPARTNILWMALREPFAARLARDPVIDHVTRGVRWPHTLVLTVTERRPALALAVADGAGGGGAGGRTYWLLDRGGVPYRVLPAPPPGVPLLEWPGGSPAGLTPGRPLADPRLADAYALIGLAGGPAPLAVREIKVDENADLCLNMRDNLQIKLGQPDALPRKVALARAAVDWRGGAFARRAACIDVSCPEQPVWTPRPAAPDGAAPNDDTRTDDTRNDYGP